VLLRDFVTVWLVDEPQAPVEADDTAAPHVDEEPRLCEVGDRDGERLFAKADLRPAIAGLVAIPLVPDEAVPMAVADGNPAADAEAGPRAVVRRAEADGADATVGERHDDVAAVVFTPETRPRLAERDVADAVPRDEHGRNGRNSRDHADAPV